MKLDAFLQAKRHAAGDSGFTPDWVPDWLFDFQKDLVLWACRKGRSAMFADCGMGKTPMQLVWAQNVVQRTNQSVLVIAPLSASLQTVREAEKFSIPCVRSRDGSIGQDARIVITNYERLHLFKPEDFAGAVCDESSILKNFDGATRAAVTEFLRRMRYRLLCTATAAPNDYIELGTSSEALGYLGYTDMLTTFFKNDEGSIEPLSYATAWRFKRHGERDFWRWLCSWARAVRKPSDIGYDDGPFVLPKMTERVTIVEASRDVGGKLFVTPARTMHEQRAERRATIRARCETAAALAAHDQPFVAWCHLNDEADLLEDIIPDARQVSGADDDDDKEETFEAFRMGQLRALVTKPRIASFGLNWQHCAHMSVFPSHSYEQYYQAVRRCWRFGQARPVTVDVISTEGEADVLGNLRRKAEAADRMFTMLVQEMHDAKSVSAKHYAPGEVALPPWMNSLAECGGR